MSFVNENPITETAYYYIRSFRTWNLGGKIPKNMRFEMEHPNTETAYNCRLFCSWILVGKTRKNLK